jgi:non-ribosomal peptide synthetase component F
MKLHAETSLQWGKEVYRTAYANSKDTEIAEAISLGVDQSTCHNYLDTDSPRHLPFGLVQNSLYAKELASAFCEKIGGVFVPIHGRLHPDARHELCAILKAAGELVKSPDHREQQRLYTMIEEAAAKARLENSITEEL